MRYIGKFLLGCAVVLGAIIVAPIVIALISILLALGWAMIEIILVVTILYVIGALAYEFLFEKEGIEEEPTGDEA